MLENSNNLVVVWNRLIESHVLEGRDAEDRAERPGGAGDRFFVNGDLRNQSTSSQWNTDDAELHLLGGIQHLLSAIGEDRGINFDGFDNNFGWGTLTLDRADQLSLEGDGALYVRQLNLLGGLSQISSIIGNNHNIYYDLGNPAKEV